MPVNFVLNHCKTQLQEVDYTQRLVLIYQWSKSGYISQSVFIELINYTVNLDLFPTED